MYSLNFEGYWIDQMAFAVPDRSGIFLVYRGSYDEMRREVQIEELLYIGEGDDARFEILSNRMRGKWLSHRMTEDETLVYAFSEVDGLNRAQITAALIHRHRPILNQDFRRTFPYHTTTLLLEGQCALLSSIFTVPGGGRVGTQETRHSLSHVEPHLVR